MKTKYFVLALGLTAVLAIHPTRAQAADGSTDVFADEGDADFDSIPTDVSKIPAAPALKVPAAAKEMEETTPVAKPEFKKEEQPVEHREIHRRNVKKEAPVAPEAVASETAAAPSNDDAAVATTTPSTKSDANGFRTTGKECPMFREPASIGEPMLTVKSEKRIWVEPKGEWVRAYSKSGPGYISADCLK